MYKKGMKFQLKQMLSINCSRYRKIPFSRAKRKQFGSPSNIIEGKSYVFTNSSFCWIGNFASFICSFISSYLPQKDPNVCVKHFHDQNKLIRKQKKVGTTMF